MILKRNTVTLYHATKRKNLESILRHGLDPVYAKPYTPSEDEIKSYLNSKGIFLDSYEARVPSYYIPGIIWLGDIEFVNHFKTKALNKFQDNSSIILKIEIPEVELRRIKIDNPALMGCKTPREFIDRYNNSSFTDKIINFGGASQKTPEKLEKEFYKRKDHMVVVKGKIDPKYITVLEDE